MIVRRTITKRARLKLVHQLDGLPVQPVAAAPWGTIPAGASAEGTRLRTPSRIEANACQLPEGYRHPVGRCLRPPAAINPDHRPYVDADGWLLESRPCFVVPSGGSEAGGRAPRGEPSPEAPARGACPPLEIYAKSRAKPPAKVWDRYGLQEVSAQILGWKRLGDCSKARIRNGGVEVWKHKDHPSASYHGLATCGSVWSCPVCSVKVGESRATDLRTGMEAWCRPGGPSCRLVTFTIPHQASDHLRDLVADFAAARSDFYRQRQWKAIASVYGIAGRVTALEVTHGKNGWHPHTHALLFLDRTLTDAEADQLQSDLFDVWADCCESAGFKRPSRAAGVKVSTASASGQYVAKWGQESARTQWGADRELARSHHKQGKKAGQRSPWAILADCAEHGRARDRALWADYSAAFKGRRQLVWSRGLRQRLGLGVEKTDEEIAAERAEGAARAVVIDAQRWRAVVRNRLRGAILAHVIAGNLAAVQSLLERLDKVPERPWRTSDAQWAAAIAAGPPPDPADLDPF